MTDYTPVSCAQHSEYELMAMHRKRVTLHFVESDRRVVGRIVDIFTHNSAEYMVLMLDDNQRKEIRLDSIKSAIPIA